MRRGSSRCSRRFWSSPAARCWSPTTPVSISDSCVRPRNALTSPGRGRPVLCTVRLARRVLTRDEAPSVRLSALARLFSASTTPTHRALDDARATVDVLHGLIERVGNQGVHTYTELRSYLPDVTPAQRRNRHLAAPLPRRPGVYLFRGPACRGALRGHGRRSAPPGQPVLQRRRPAHPHQGDGVAGHRGRPRRVRARPGGGRARATAARRTRAALQPPLEISAPVVVGGADRRGVSAVLHSAGTEARLRGRPVSLPRRRRADGRAAGPVHRRADMLGTAGPVTRFTARGAPNAKSRHAPRRATSAPPTTPAHRSVPAT